MDRGERERYTTTHRQTDKHTILYILYVVHAYLVVS